MDLKGLLEICGDLGFFKEDDGVRSVYKKSEFCLDNLKDLQRFLRRDDPQTRDVFTQLCKWNTVSEDLVPIIEQYQNDRNLVINAVKVLVFLTMPIDPASDNIPQQIEYLWSLKAAVSRNVTIAVIVSLLEDPLEHLEHNAFTEDDWKLVQLVLTLFRNVLAIQDISLQQKASGSATQFLCLRDKFLELMFHDNVMDLILVLTQHVTSSRGYLRQDNTLLLEIYYYIFFGQDPELIAKVYQKGLKVDGDIKTSLNSLESIMEEEEERRRLIRLQNLNRHSQFSGTFTRLAVDGSKTLFKGSPATGSGDSLLRAHKVQRGPLKRIAWDQGNLSLPKGNILEFLHDFVNQFLSGGYNVLMQSIRMDIEKEHHGIQKSDVVVFLQLAHFATTFQRHKFSISKPYIEKSTSEVSSINENADDTLFHGDICGPIAATMNEAMFFLVISKWHDAFDGLKQTSDFKFLSASGSLMKDMIQMLDLVLKLLPEHSKEPQTARILLYKIFYDQTDQGLTQFVVNLIRAFDTHKQPKSDLADLVEIIHVVLQLMEKLQARGSLRVSRKSRKSRKKKQFGQKNEAAAEAEAENIPEVNGCVQNVDDQNLEIGNACVAPNVNLNEFPKEDLTNSSLNGKEESTLVPNQIEGNEVPLLDSPSLGNDSVQIDKSKSIDGLNDLADDFSDDDEPPALNEVDFSVTKLVSAFVNNTVIRNLCWLLKFYKSNSTSTNQHIVGMLKRICDDLELSPILYQLSLLTIFYDILSDQKSSSCKEYENVVSFLTKLVRELMKKMKNQPLLFIEILFWKTRKECHYITSESLLHELGNLKKQSGGCGNILGDDGETGPSTGKEVLTRRSIADALGEDEADFIISHEDNDHMEETPLEDNNHLTGENIYDSVGHLKHSRKRIQAFSKEQELMVRDLFEQFKSHKRCAHMIANALDADNKYTAAQISRKLKQLGLHIPQKKRRLEASSQSGQDNDDKNILAESKGELFDGETLLELKKRRKAKVDGKLIYEEATMTNTSKRKIKSQLPQEDDSDDQTLSTVLQKSRKKFSKKKEDKATSIQETVDDGLEAMTTKKVIQSDGSTQEKEMSPSLRDVNVAAVDLTHLDENLEDELAAEKEAGGVVLAEAVDISSKVNSLPNQVSDELEDSGDDREPEMPKSFGVRRKLRMVIDLDDDDE